MLKSLSILFVTTLSLCAQTYTGSIRGRVIDSSGLPVSGAQITAIEVNTNSAQKAITTGSGDYLLSFLKAGAYELRISAPGFKEQTETSIHLELNQALSLSVQLQIGATTDRVDVSADASEINEVSSEIGHVIDSQRLLDLPLLNGGGRSPMLLSKIVPGASSTSSNNSNINNFSFGGGRPVSNEILIDGLPTTNPSDQTYTLTPAPESIDQMKVITSPFSSEYGHTGGGVVLLTSNSGTNVYHGSVYDYFRNRILNGRNFFQPAQSNTKYVQNDPGGTFGGPVRLPGYHGKDKTFFFTDFNVTLSSTATAYATLVPTDLERSGNFSQSQAGSGLVSIYDPTSNHVGPDGKTIVRNQFPGNIIPSSRIDSVAKQILSFYPEPNGNFGGGLNYSVTPPAHKETWQWLTRFDHNFSDIDKAFFRMGQFQPNSDALAQIPGIANNSTAGGWRDTQIVIGETHVFSPSMVNDFRAGFVQEHNYTINDGGPAGALGLKGVALEQFPTVTTTGFATLGASATSGDRDRSWVFNDALSIQRGSHTIKVGGDFRRQMYNNYSPGKLSGSYTFAATFSALPGNANTGSALADLLLGDPTSTAISFDDYTYRLNINSASVYFQDDYKILPNLTINLGLRWEFDGPYSEANNQFASFNPNIVNPTTGNLGAVQFAGRNGAPTHFSPNIYDNFLPRIGLAYKFLPKTVFRAGYGVYRFPSIGFASYGPSSQYAVSAAFTSADSGITPAFRLQNGVPPYTYNVDGNGNPNIPASLTKPSSNVTEVETRDRTPYTQNWQAGIQHQISKNWVLEVDYMASKGVHLPIALPENQLFPSQFSLNAQQSLRPYPQYLNVTALLNEGNSNYQSLQAKLEHRFADGLVISAAYTFSKTLVDVDGPARTDFVGIQNVYNLAAEKGISGTDVPQRFVTSYVWQIPVGRGGKYFTGVPIAKDVISGWSLAGITEFQVGLPVSVTQTNQLGGFTSVQRPNQVSNPLSGSGIGTVAEWFNTAAFVAAPALTLGNAARFPFHGPGLENWDSSLMRNFVIRERTKLQLRGEFYNLFNHTNFGNPNTTINTKAFGSISSAQAPRTIEVVLRIFF
jgi:hypothetical protein